MIGVQLARQLREAGLGWKPGPGDRFAIPDRDLDDEIFVLSTMTIEVYPLPDGPVIGFNGTTEWALDDVELDEAIWLPREDQLRELLGGTFQTLRRSAIGSSAADSSAAGSSAADSSAAVYEVLINLLGEDRTFAGPTAEQAYGAALLHLLAAAGAQAA